MCTVYRYVKFSRLVRILKKSKTPAEVISLQETWHGHNSWVIHDIELCGYRVIHKPRSNTQPQRYQRGGVATVCLDTRLKFSPITLRIKPSTMEYVVTIVQLRSHICRVINVYRPGSRKATKIFFSKLENLIKRYSMRKKMWYWLVTWILRWIGKQTMHRSWLICWNDVGWNRTSDILRVRKAVSFTSCFPATKLQLGWQTYICQVITVYWPGFRSTQEGNVSDKRDWIMHKYPRRHLHIGPMYCTAVVCVA